MVGKDQPEYVHAAPSVVVHTVTTISGEKLPVPGHQVLSVLSTLLVVDYYTHYVTQNLFQRSKPVFWWEVLSSFNTQLI